MELMVKKQISGLPVVEDDMSLVGIITEKDVVNLAYSVIYEADTLEKKKVRNFMTEPAVSFDKDRSLLDVCDFLGKNVFRRVPITSGGKLVGLISIPDIVAYILSVTRKREAVAPQRKS